jgi:transposase-like protein
MKKLFSPKQKAHIALEAIKGVKPMSALASEYEAHPIQIGIWKKTLLEHAEQIFSDKRKRNEEAQQALTDRLYQVIGQRDIELDWLKKKLHLAS